MPRLSYPYSPLPEYPTPRPMAPAIAINLLNGKSSQFVGILDTGADYVSFPEGLIDVLEIDRGLLLNTEVGGMHGIGPVKMYDFMKIGLLELPSTVAFFPNHNDPIPVHFKTGSPFFLLGQKSFLSNCIASFDGIKKVSTISF